MKLTLLKHLRLLIVLGTLFTLSLVVSLVPVEYTTTAPGYNDEVGGFITIKDAYPTTGTLHTTSVIVLNRTSILQYVVGNLEPKVDVEAYPEFYSNINVSDLRVMGYLSKDDSVARSLVVGITRSGKQIDYTTDIMVYLTYTYLDPNTIELGDVVTAVNGNTDVATAAEAVGCGETAEFSILRDGEPMTFTITKHELESNVCRFGMQLRTYTEINSSEVDYTIHPTNTGGSSGGLMQALYVFNELTPHDITGGHKIAGTGTIDIDGSVGAIGGIRQKIITSALNGIDVFFVPHLSDSEYDNYVVAKATLETLHTNMVLVPVTSIDDAIQYLEQQYGGAFSE